MSSFQLDPFKFVQDVDDKLEKPEAWLEWKGQPADDEREEADEEEDDDLGIEFLDISLELSQTPNNINMFDNINGTPSFEATSSIVSGYRLGNDYQKVYLWWLARYGCVDVVVHRDHEGKPIWRQPNLGVPKFGRALKTPKGTAWEFDRYGAINPLFMEAIKIFGEKRLDPGAREIAEHNSHKFNFDPVLDGGINFDKVVIHYNAGIPRRINVVFDAPNTGTCGPSVQYDGYKFGQVKVYKFDDSEELNPLFVQIRKVMIFFG